MIGPRLARLLTTSTGLAFLLLALVSSPGSAQIAAQTSTISPEQQLAEKFAPIVMIKQQEHECSSAGEQFRPVVVDILFGTDDVRLMRRGEKGKPNQEIKRNIQASDLFELDDSYYIDLPFEPRNPGCNYEQWGKKRMAELGIAPSLYAHVTSEPGKDGVVVQFWYYWIYNLFNDVHESDWEGIQVDFAASSVQEVLDKNLMPSSIAFAQHEGGELGHIGEDKVEMNGTHVVSHPSSGSHADYYQEAVWLGWGENGSGFGCDHSDAPDVEIPVHIVLLPSKVTDSNSEFAWLTFEGNWGEIEKPSLFSGPQGPMQHWRWHHPVTWSEEIRKNSLPVPVHPTIGPGISQVFCGAAELGSRIVRVFPIEARLMSLLLAAIGAGLLFLTFIVWRYTWQAISLYFRHGYFFITVGVLGFPIAAVGQQLEVRLQNRTDSILVTHLPHSTYWRAIWAFVANAVAGSIQEVLLSAIIGPIVIIGAYLIHSSEEGTSIRTARKDFHIYPRVAASRMLYALLVGLMALSIVLIPLAIYKGVQWFFAPQAVVIDDVGVRGAFAMSERRVHRDWLRSAAMTVAVFALIGLVGPLFGTALVTLGGVSLELAQWISAVLFCVLYPIGAIAATLFYLHRTLLARRASTPMATEDPTLATGALPV